MHTFNVLSEYNTNLQYCTKVAALDLLLIAQPTCYIRSGNTRKSMNRTGSEVD